MHKFLGSAAALCLACGPAFAADDSADAQGDTIIVTGRDDGYAPIETTTATKTPTPLIDVPQSVQVVTRALIEDQAMRSLADVVRYVPGVTIGQGEGHRDQLTLRGNNSTADFFIDGIRDDVQHYRGLYNVERVEVLKGPNAMIFGRGGGGGIINRVSKAPTFDQAVAGALSVDTFGAWYAEGDVNLPVAEGAAVRLNGVYEHGDNHRDAFAFDRWALNPTAAVTLGDATKLGVSYEHADDERVVDRGVPSVSDGNAATINRPLQGFRDTFFGARGVNSSDFDAHVLRATLEHRFTDSLTLTSKLLYGDYDKQYRNAFTAGAVQPNGTVAVDAYQDITARENFFSQNDLVWTVATGAIEHVLLAGFEYGDQSTDNQRINGFFDSGVPTTNGGRRTVVPLADPFVVPPVTFRAGPGNRSVHTEADVLAFYAQDQVAFGEHVEVVAGLRYDRFELEVDDLLGNASFTRTDDLWSPRLGLVLKPIETVSIYASCSRSYLPQSGDQFLSLDVTAEALKPEKFENYEIGVKWAVNDALSFTAAAYQLDRTNTRAAGPTPGTVVLTGEQRSRGVELNLQGRILPQWQVSFGYALQDAEITETTSAAPAGRDVPQVPEHQLSLWNRYDLGDRFGVGLGVYHQSKSFASISNAVVLPSYTRVDAALFVAMTESIEAQLNIENLLDDGYFPTAHNDNNISTGAPINARFTLRAKF